MREGCVCREHRGAETRKRGEGEGGACGGLLGDEAELCLCRMALCVQVDAFLRKWAPLIRSRGEQFMAQP